MCLYVKQGTEKYMTPLYRKEDPLYISLYIYRTLKRVWKKLLTISPLRNMTEMESRINALIMFFCSIWIVNMCIYCFYDLKI